MTRPATSAADTTPRGQKYLIHGAPGTGKTPLAGSYVRRPGALGKAVYVPCDRKEGEMLGILPTDRGNIIRADYGGRGQDPYSYVKSVLEYDWTQEGADTIIIDTGTQLANDYLSAATDSGQYNAKAVTYGTETFKLSDKPHWGMAHRLMTRTLDAVMECPLHVLMLFWSDYMEPQDGAPGAWGGPLTVNMNESKKVAGRFPNILYTRTALEGGRTNYYAHTESYGIWVARLAGVQPNPIPSIRLEVDPVNAWREIAKVRT